MMTFLSRQLLDCWLVMLRLAQLASEPPNTKGLLSCRNVELHLVGSSDHYVRVTEVNICLEPGDDVQTAFTDVLKVFPDSSNYEDEKITRKYTFYNLFVQLQLHFFIQ